MSRTAHRLGLDHLGGQAETLEHEDHAIGQVELPPAMPDRGRGGVAVVVVMPTLSHGHQRDEPVVPAALVGLVIAVTDQVGQRVDRPGCMPSEHGAHQAAPDEEAQAELERPHSGPRRHPAGHRADDRIHEEVSQIDRGAQIRLLQSHVERVLKNVIRIFLHRSDGSGRGVLIEQPVEMTPQEVDERAVRVGLLVGKDVMHPMHGHPLGRGILQGTLCEEGETVLEPLGHGEAAVSQQPVVAQRDAQAIERHAQNGQSDSGPAKQPGNERRQGRQMNRRDRNHVKPDHAVKADGGRKREGSGTRGCAGRRAGRNGFPNRRRRRAEVAHVGSIPSIRGVLMPTAVTGAEAGDWS